MSKATPADLSAEGFDRKNFGMQPGAGTDGAWTAYLQAVLDEASAWAENRIGAALYAATVTPAYAFFALRRAELCYAGLLLWNRRVAYHDAAAVTDRQEGQYAERREYLRHAQAALDCANSNIAEAMQALGIDAATQLDGLGTSVGHIETGRYPLASAGALNA